MSSAKTKKANYERIDRNETKKAKWEKNERKKLAKQYERRKRVAWGHE